jgi:hypothetical protein
VARLVVAALGLQGKPWHLALDRTNWQIGKTNLNILVLSAEWTEWISKLLDYVRDLQAQSGHLVERVVVCSGQWLVIFTEPGVAFLDPARNILVFRNDTFVRHSDEIFRQISYDELVGTVPAPLRPTQLPTYIAADSVRRMFRALWIRWLSAGSVGALDTFPQIYVYPAAIVERDDGALIQVVDKVLGRTVFPPILKRSHSI